MNKRPSIQELEALLNSEEETPIEILPNGEIREKGQTILLNWEAVSRSR